MCQSLSGCDRGGLWWGEHPDEDSDCVSIHNIQFLVILYTHGRTYMALVDKTG